MTSTRGERLAWAGPGATVHLRRPAGSVDSGGASRPVGAEGPGWDGTRLVEASNVVSWIGEDGGPGERDGLCAFLDDEDIGSVVLPPVRPDALAPVLRFALEHPELFLFVPSVEPTAGVEPELSRPLPNVARLRVPDGSRYGASDLARYIACRDFVPRWTRSVDVGPGSVDTAMVEPGIWSSVEVDVLPILAWRRWRGLERSLDRGTRWVIFESAMPAMVRSIDRAVRGFLRQLTLDGLLRSFVGREVAVTYESERGVEEEGRLVLRVRVELSGEFGVVLPRSIERSTSLVPSVGR